MKKFKALGVLIICTLLFSGVKPNSQSVGLSLFDLFSVIACIVLIYVISAKQFKIRKRIFYPVFAISFIPVISTFLNFQYIGLANWLYAIRFFEYFIWLYLACLVDFERLVKLIKLFVLICVIGLLFGPYVGLIYGPFNYIWELSAFGSVAFYFILYFDRCTNLKSKSPYLLACVFMVFWAGQRTPVVALTVVIFLQILFQKGSGQRGKFLSSIFIIVGVLYLSFTENRIKHTFEQFFKMENLYAVEYLLERSSQSTSYDDFVYGERKLIGDAGDLSFQLRLKKWTYAAAQQYSRPETILYGLGAGFFGGAADSSLVRIYFETGLIGVAVWLLFFIRVCKCGPQLSLFVLLIVLNASFIDILHSSRIMTLFLIIIGSQITSYSINSRRTLTGVIIPRGNFKWVWKIK
jgi:hypothetical protein